MKKVFRLAKRLFLGLTALIPGVRQRRSERKFAAISQQVNDYKPQVVLYMGGGRASAYQGNMWFKVLEKLDARVMVVTRQRGVLGRLAATTLPCLRMTSMRQLELLNDIGVSVVLYASNTALNFDMLRFAHMQHFFINHGESDKVVNDTKVARVYDKLLVAGPIAERRLMRANLNINPERIVHVGRPTVELDLTKVQGFPRDIVKILYAPTWEGLMQVADYTSVNKMGLALLQQLCKINKYQVSFRPHPMTGTKNSEVRAALSELQNFCLENNIECISPTTEIYHDLNRCDLLISDLSSVVTDYLYTAKPVILVNAMAMQEDLLLEQFPSTRATYVLNNVEDIGAMLDEIASKDPKLAEREIVLKQVFGDIPEGYMSRFSSVIKAEIR
jgi:hypothetical protein